jgi:hypothetical protein
MRPKRSFQVLAGICILFGILFLLENYGALSGVYNFWPIFPLVVGLGLNLLYFRRGRRDPIALGMGMYLILFSSLAFYCNFTSWAVIATLWPLFAGFMGVSLLVVAYFEKKQPVMILIGLCLCLLCLTFILVFTIDLRLWPISLVLFGIFILLIRRYWR